MSEENCISVLTAIKDFTQKYHLTSTDGKICTLIGNAVTASSLVLLKSSGGVTKPIVGAGMMLSNAGKLLGCCMAYPETLNGLCNKDSGDLIFATNQVAALQNLVTCNPFEIMNTVFKLRESYKFMKIGAEFVKTVGYKEAGKLLFQQGIPAIGKLFVKMQFKQILRLGIRASAHVFIPCVSEIAFIGVELLASYFEVDKYFSPLVESFAGKVISAVTSWLSNIW